MSKIKLKKTTLILEIHGTASGPNILKYLSTEEDIKKYLDDMFYLENYANNLIKKYNCEKTVYGSFAYYPLCAVPENSTVSEGIKYADAIRLAEYVLYKEKYLINSDKFAHCLENFSHNIFNSSIFKPNH